MLFDLIDLYHFDLKDDVSAERCLEELAQNFPTDDLVTIVKRLLQPTPELLPQAMQHAAATALIRRPQSFSLASNYPNPFNAETEICYQLPQACQVTMKIYNLLGRELRTLVDHEQTAGEHIVRWDSRDADGQALPSGIYIYRLQAGSFVACRKLALVR
ncbi:MAG: T9SS type A sorting domain-containing protein [candidate division KSB1 bacterium]|nr:T9SS type A sorting domain-containing protein [candidate division KSB1 bacterium]